MPFFYLVTGYFLGKACSDDKSILAFKLKKSCHKWLNLWLKYTLALLFISIILDVCLGQIESWTWNDTYTMLMSGVCAFIDQHEWKLQTYGISTLWFLYCGFLAFCIIYIMRKFVYTAWFLLIIIICQVSFAFFIYNGVTNWLFFYSTLPFLYYGMLIGHYYKNFRIHLRTGTLIFFCIVFFGSAVAEYYYTGKEVIFMNIPLSLSLFMLILKSNKIATFLYEKQLLPQNSNILTLDVYVWHRLVYYMLSVLGIKMYGCDAIVVFLITLTGSVIIRNLLKRNLCL